MSRDRGWFVGIIGLAVAVAVLISNAQSQIHPWNYGGTCTLDGLATASCAIATLPASTTKCVCSSTGTFGLGALKCPVSGSTVTVTSALTLDTSPVNVLCW